jgi:2-polyprenyl-6-methoxyphenol hydroxylase-like FAD-dependent oxidoreductase
VALAGVVTEPGPGSVPRVVGVRAEAGEEVRGDLVVDALGRRSPMARWLVEAGAREPIVEEEDSGFVYYGRHVRTADASPLGPQLAFFGSIGILLLPAEAGVTGVGIISWSGDAELRALRHEEPWRAVMALLPDGPSVLAAEPLGPVVAMTGIEDRYRRYVVDGDPVATGVVSVADAWACTNPTLGRGMSLGARHARALRDVIREVGTDPEAVVRRFDEVTEEQQTPWYRSTVWHDRHRIDDIQAAIDGREREPDELWERFHAFQAAAFGDLTLLPHFLATFRLELLADDLLNDPEVVAHMEAQGLKAGPHPGPSRHEVLAAVASAQ